MFRMKFQSNQVSTFGVVCCIVVGLVICFVVSTYSATADYVELKIEPEDVGVFYVNGAQQFTAFGRTATGGWVDITTQVDWYVEEYPFAEQTMKAEDVVRIDGNGLATVISTWGRVNVSACFPKGCYYPLPQIPAWLAGINLLLLKKKNEEEPESKYIPAINFLLLK